MNSVGQVRKRMSAGQPDEGDLMWCRQRLTALKEWPEALDEAQATELDALVRWIETHGRA